MNLNLPCRTLVLALAACLIQPVSAVEELVAPANAIPDGASILMDDSVPVSPYDAVPYESDPAVGVYSQSPALPEVEVPGPSYHDAPSFYAPPVAVAPAVCCKQPKIRYWNHPLLAKDVCPCDCNETVETFVEVPCQCCPVAVKVCVPVCCTGAPQCSTRRDLLGRKTYEYCWPCGYRIKIVDRHTGTLVVHTFNP